MPTAGNISDDAQQPAAPDGVRKRDHHQSPKKAVAQNFHHNLN